MAAELAVTMRLMRQAIRANASGVILSAARLLSVYTADVCADIAAGDAGTFWMAAGYRSCLHRVINPLLHLAQLIILRDSWKRRLCRR